MRDAMTVQDRLEERALEQHIRQRTVRLLDLTDKRCGGSGVTIRLGNRCFVATAAHVIPSNHDIQILVGDGHEDNVGQFAARHIDEEHDVGLLELDGAAARRINREFTEPGAFLRQVDQAHAYAATVVGYPGQLAETESRIAGDTLFRTHSFRTLTLVTTLIPLADWPTSNLFQRRQPDAAFDHFVSFDSTLSILQRNLTDLDGGESPSAIDEVHLAGMSGGGIWLEHRVEGKLWTASPILAGLITGATRNWARGTQMNCWLRLVVRHYPEFREIERQLDLAS